MPGRKLAVIGASGSGKTTLSRVLAARLGVPHVELDALCHGPNWTEASDEEFRERVLAAMAPDGWVIDGNYEGKLGDLVLQEADTAVWLDLPLPVILWRLLRRTLPRILFRIELWNGNRESFRTAFIGRESLFGWAIYRHGDHRRRMPQRLAREHLSHLTVVRLRTPGEVRRWVQSFMGSSGQ